LRKYLEKKDEKLAKTANSLWDKSVSLHDRQNSPDSNENGRIHVKKVENNIYRLLELYSRIDNKKHIDNYSAFELFILSCSACCHDFDKALKIYGLYI